MSRFAKLEEFFVEEGRLYFNELWINPFQIESFLPLEVSYINDTNEEVDMLATKIITKSGMEHNIKILPEELEGKLF
jgi:hypothetical protein